MAISVTKSILPETAKFSANILYHEYISKSSPDNIPNFTNPLYSIIETGNYTFTFKETTSQPVRMGFVEAIRKEICANEIDKKYNLVIRRELNSKILSCPYRER